MTPQVLAFHSAAVDFSSVASQPLMAHLRSHALRLFFKKGARNV